MGAVRHLALLPALPGERAAWPVPFADGIARLLALRGRRVVVLASGNPFWFGAGSVLARHLRPGEWHALPGVSTFALAAARMGWPLEAVACHGLHAAPFERLRPALAPDARAIVLLRDGAAARGLAEWLTAQGFGATQMRVMEALGGPGERVRGTAAAAYTFDDVAHPVCAALTVQGAGKVLPLTAGRGEDWFENDGQITKGPVRAMTLASLAPTAGAHLWDIGAGSGSVAIEWLLAGSDLTATAVEADPARAARIRANAAALGVAERLTVIEGQAPAALDDVETAATAVFIGGGLSEALIDALWARIAQGTRVVANAVTLEGEALLAALPGGALMRIEISRAAPLGGKRGWKAAYPVVQWSGAR